MPAAHGSNGRDRDEPEARFAARSLPQTAAEATAQLSVETTFRQALAHVGAASSSSASALRHLQDAVAAEYRELAQGEQASKLTCSGEVNFYNIAHSGGKNRGAASPGGGGSVQMRVVNFQASGFADAGTGQGSAGWVSCEGRGGRSSSASSSSPGGGGGMVVFVDSAGRGG